jgi:hypothetical protein
MSDGTTHDAGYVRGRAGVNASKSGRSGGGYYSGGASSSAKNWIDYVSGTSEEPTLNTTLPSGPVYNYVYGGKTLYRHIPDLNPYEDTFYSNFDGTNLSGIVVTRSMNI